MNFDITFDKPPVEDESPQEAWRRRVDGSILKLKADVTADDIAAEYPDVTDDVAEELAAEAVSNAFEHGDTDGVVPADFPSVDQLDADVQEDQPTTDGEDDGDSSMPFHKRREQEVAATPADHADEPADENEEQTDTAPGSGGDSTATEADASESDAGGERDALEARVDELESKLREQAALTEALQRQNRQLSQLLIGEDTVGMDVDADAMTDFLTRSQDVDDRLVDLEQRVAMVRSDGSGTADGPDGRARVIRQTLYNKAKNSEGLATLTRDEADSRLGGGLHRDSVLGAMKRAADGHQATSEHADLGYRPVNGASELEPVESVTFERGEGRSEQSRVVMDLSDATGTEVRHNLTTKDTEEGA